MFKGIEFQYDGKSSSDFSLKIVKFSQSGLDTDSIGVPLEIEESKIKRNAKPFFYGVETTPKLSFKLELAYMPNENVQTYIPRGVMGSISKWLFKREYKELKIIDADYSNIIYNCMFQNPKQIEVGNVAYGIEVDVICDRPYGFRRQNISKTIVGSSTFNIKNLGFDNDYIYPEIEFTTSNSFSIKNNTDNNNTFAFTGLGTNETIYVNNERQEIISSTGLNRNSNFNSNWFRLTPDYYNNITIIGSGAVEFRIEFPMPY